MRPTAPSCAIVALTVAASALGAAAQPVTQEWTRTATFPPYTYGTMVAVGPDQNVISVGWTPGASDIVTTKHDGNGNQLWQAHYTMPSYELVSTWVAVDASGNVIVTGYPQTFSGNPVQVGLLTLKYDSSGALLWDDLYPGTWAFTTRAIVDDAGNIYVTGRGWFGTHDFITIKYASDGTVVWQDIFDQNGGFHTPTAMDLDANGNLLVTGTGLSGGLITALYDAAGVRQWVIEQVGIAGGSVRFTGDGHFLLTGSLYSPPTSNDFMLLKYDLGGQPTWERFYDFGGSEAGKKLALDAQGNVYVTGIQGVYSNWLTLKTDADGHLLWSRIYDAHAYNDEYPNFLVTGPQGEAYITGVGGPPPPGPNLSYLSMVTLRYDADGTTAWTQTHYQWASRGVGVALGSDNSVYAVGMGNSITTIKYAQPVAGLAAAAVDPRNGPTLFPAAPNPFRSDVALRYELTAAGPVHLAVFDVSGRMVANLVSGTRGAGVHQVVWNGRDDSGAATSPGVYLVRLQSGSGELTDKVVRVR
jgi:hypothetical protein